MGGAVMAQQVERRAGMVDLQKQIDVLGVGQRQLHEQISELAVEQHQMTARMEEAIERGFEKAVDKLLEKAQTKAAEHTGRWLWGTLKAAVTRWMVIGLVVMLAYKYLGSGAATAVIDAVKGK